MIGGLAVLMLFQLAGEVISSALALPVPGPVIGMLLLFLALLAWGQAPRALDTASDGLLAHFSLFFIPAGTGVIAYLTLIRQEWLPITVSLVGSTVITIAVTAVTMQWLVRRRSGLSPQWGKSERKDSSRASEAAIRRSSPPQPSPGGGGRRNKDRRDD